jgi:hypothetical protein
MKSRLIGSSSADEANGWPRVLSQEEHHSVDELQLGHVDVEVHPVDALHFEGDVIGEDFGGTAGYGHIGLRSTQAHCGQPTASGGSKRDRKAPHLGSTGAYDRPRRPATGESPSRHRREVATTPLVGLGRSPVSLDYSRDSGMSLPVSA